MSSRDSDRIVNLIDRLRGRAFVGPRPTRAEMDEFVALTTADCRPPTRAAAAQPLHEMSYTERARLQRRDPASYAAMRREQESTRQQLQTQLRNAKTLGERRQILARLRVLDGIDGGPEAA